MKTSLLLVVASTLLASCAQYVPVRGSYQKGPYTLSTQKTKDAIWEDLMDLVSRNGFPVSVLDKSSGLLVVGPTAIEITRELGPYDRGRDFRRDDQPVELRLPDAAGVAGYNYAGGTFTYSQVGLTRWNVRVREDGDRRSVSVGLYDVQLKNMNERGVMTAGTGDKKTPIMEKMEEMGRVYSTGHFERTIAEVLTR